MQRFRLFNSLAIAFAVLLMIGIIAPVAPGAAQSQPTSVYLPLLMSPPAPSLQTVEERTRAEEVVRLVNIERAAAGCPALVIEEHLVAAAQKHSKDMGDNNFFNHIGSDGSRFFNRTEAADYTGNPGGENIAAGYPTPAIVMEGWLTSDGHRKNMLNCNFREIGVGYYYAANSTYRSYWTQVFGR
ncbi:MAG: CAP domain-containing protein [Oscillochloris sp.]|nr:CAP domain-containing protein [Oscillochloris sp.]